METPGRTLGVWMKVKAHPRQPDWLLAKVRRRACEEADAATNPWCAYDLFVSQARGPGLPPARASLFRAPNFNPPAPLAAGSMH